MAEPTRPTLQELLAQQAATNLALAAYEAEPIQAAQAALGEPSVAALIAAMTEARDNLPDGQAKTQISNVVTVLTVVPDVLNTELARINTILNPPVPPEGPLQ